MRVAFLGNARWSVPSLEALANSSHDPVLVVTRVPRPAGRGSELTPTAVADAARHLELPLAEVETVKAGPGLEALRSSTPDALVVVAYGEILPREILELPRVAPVNVHFSLLPELRGAAPVQRAIMIGLQVTGVTTMLMDEGLDTGPILLRAEERIAPEDDSASLGDRLAAIGGRLLVDTLDRLEARKVEPHAQDEARATYAPKLRPEERIVEWRADADAIARLVRAMAPEPGATTSFRGRGLKILGAVATSEVPPQSAGGVAAQPGTIVEASRDRLLVVAGRGVLGIHELAPEGRRRMTATEFVNGYRPRIGESLA